jgi:threonine dehydratase
VTPAAAIDVPSGADVLAAAERLASRVLRTRVLRSDELDAASARRVFLKCEDEQVGRAFKYRGALNALLQMPDDARGATILTHSSGNHGTALALAARELGLACCVVMPSDTSAIKVDSVRAAGAEIVFCEPGLEAREAAVARLRAARRTHLVHPFDDARVIAGAGTATLELLQDAPTLSYVVAPIGGGGLVGGACLAAAALPSAARVVAAEPELADDAARSLRTGVRQRLAGSPPTIADGLRGSIGERNFALLRAHAIGVVVVSEEQIVAAMRWAYRQLGRLIEPSSAVALAAVLQGLVGEPGSAVGIVVSGGNLRAADYEFLGD